MLARVDILGATGPARASWRDEAVASTNVAAIMATSAIVDLRFLLFVVFTVRSLPFVVT
jgi:hypothetical protein